MACKELQGIGTYSPCIIAHVLFMVSYLNDSLFLQVNPHLFLQAVMESIEKHFAQSDPAEFMPWLLKTLHAELRGLRDQPPTASSGVRNIGGK